MYMGLDMVGEGRGEGKPGCEATQYNTWIGEIDAVYGSRHGR